MRKLSCIVVGALLVLGSLPTMASDLDPELRAKIEHLMELTGVRAMGKQMGGSMMEQMTAGMKAASPEDESRVLEISIEVATEFLDEEYDVLFDGLVPLYAKYYTEADVDALIAFYSTPTGRKVVETMPALVQESMQIGVDWSRERMPELEHRIQARLINEGILKD